MTSFSDLVKTKPAWFLAPLALFFLLLLFGRWSIRSKLRQARDANDFLRSALARFNLKETSFYKRTYWHGQIRGIPVWFRWSYQLKLPYGNHLVLFMSAKVPHTEGMRLYLAPLVEGFLGDNATIASAAGWQSTGDGFSIGKLKNTMTEQQMSAFDRLSVEAKSELKKNAERGRGGTLYPQYENFLIGEVKALRLAGGDAKIHSRLDLQTKLAFEIGKTPDSDFQMFVDDSLNLAEKLADDFSRRP